MPVKPTPGENEYFARQDAAKLRQAAEDRRRQTEAVRSAEVEQETARKRFRKILVYVNTHKPNNHALDRGGVLARRTGASLRVVDVVESLPELLRGFSVDGEKVAEAIAEEKKERLEAAVAPLRASGVSVQTDVLIGTAFAAIIHDVLRNRHDLVMKTADRDGSTRLFGSTAVHLMRKCPCPVWVVKPVDDFHGPRILAAVDPVSQAAGADDLNRRIVDLGRAVAASEGGELHIVHAWQAPYEDSLATSARIPKADLDAYISEAREKVRTRFHEFIGQFEFKLPARQKHVLRGSPGLIIPRFAAQRGINLIVMGTTARTGISGMLIGNSAERILGQVECSVLVVKPEGFASPVKPAA